MSYEYKGGMINLISLNLAHNSKIRKIVNLLSTICCIFVGGSSQCYVFFKTYIGVNYEDSFFGKITSVLTIPTLLWILVAQLFTPLVSGLIASINILIIT